VVLNQLRKHNVVAGQAKIVGMVLGKAATAAKVVQTRQKAKHGQWNGVGKDFALIRMEAYIVMVVVALNASIAAQLESIGGISRI
jgi:hypothetical protein